MLAPTLHDLLPLPPLARYTLQDWIEARPEMSNTSHAGIELWLAALSELARLVECAVLAMPHARCLGRRLGCWASGQAWAAPRTPEARLGNTDPDVST